MNRPKICAVIVDNDLDQIKKAEALVDIFEVRIDLIGDSWQELATQLNKPWIACNRPATEGGQWEGNETERVDELLKAIKLGADIIDIELETAGLAEAVSLIKKQAKCLLSFHDLMGTPPPDRLRKIVQQQLAAGADVCKVVTTARKFEDNMTVLQLISEFPKAKVISFAMGDLGLISRILCPLVGGDFTYASIEKGKESAYGQITINDLMKLYEMVTAC
jgi:3-dehydroquinate dehydratase type I